MKEAAFGAQTLFGTRNQPMFFTSSGTGVMEAALANVLGEDDKALILNNGSFGERFAQIAKSLGRQADQLTAPWGEAVPIDAIASQLEKDKYRAVVAVHNESSTGAVADLEAIGKVVRDSSALLVVDSVSSLGGMELRQDEWGVDVIVSGSQKALMCPPGAGLVSVSDKAWSVMEDDRAKPGFYWDFKKARMAAEKNETPYTSPISLIFGMREALRMINEEGWENVLARHARLANEMQTGGAALGLSVFTESPLVSNTVVVFAVPEGRDGSEVVRHMKQHFSTVIAGIRNEKMNGKLIRIGTMGACTSEDIRQDLEYLKMTFEALGWPLRFGTGADSAGEALRRST
jgi:aspartate aminotransferase-like enzyme